MNLHFYIYICFIVITNITCTDDKQELHTETLKIREEQPVGTRVGFIPSNGVKNPAFKFIEHQEKFNLNTTTGELTSKFVFDREALSEDYLRNGFQLFVKISDQVMILVKVIIEDVNDRKPMFKDTVYRTTVDEDIIEGHPIEFPNAKDNDVGVNAETEYRIVSGDVHNNFKIEERSYNRINKKYFLVRKNPLDVETQTEKIQLNISACDKLLPTECSYLKVIVKVADVNDNHPVIDDSLQDHIKIYENVTRDKPIFKVHATDADQGLNGEVEYGIFDVKMKEFAINQNTGEIYVTQNLDAEKRDSFTLLIIAQDKGTNPRKATLELHITVLDCNDKRPVLHITPERIDGDYNILEGTPVDTIIGTIKVTDDDLTDDNNQITNIELINGLDYFALYDNVETREILGKKTWIYTIYIKKVIDRETTPFILISARAKDNGLPTLFGEANFTMYIDDINDNFPIFTQRIYYASVNESEKIGKHILTVSSKDEDLAQNSEISYSITSKPGIEYFFMKEETGEIFLNENIDRERNSYMVLNISARDHGIPTRTSHTIVNVTILDANDNDPFFVQSDMTFGIKENSNNRSFIGTIGVYDNDIIGSDQLECFLTSTQFVVERQSCKLFSNVVFDREKISEYTVTMTVKDSLGRKSQGLVHIVIRDVNDNEPKFVTNHFNISIHNDYRVGSDAAYPTAYDADVGENAKAFYNASFSDDVFSINNETGALILNRDLRKMKRKYFSFKVQVWDRNKQLKVVDESNVDIHVLPPSTLPPVFQNSSYHFFMKENNLQNSTIGQVKAKRPISNSDAFIKYAIKDGNTNNIFIIDDFGRLGAVQVIDYEKYRYFSLVIEADDTLHPALASNVSVVINVTDVNDNQPTFDDSNVVIHVNEGVPIGHVLYTCNALDNDSDKLGEVHYSLKNATGHFFVDSSTGVVKTNSSLDFESNDFHVIFIEACDRGEPPKCTMLKVSVYVNDVNDNAPLFYNTSYVIHVPEDQKVNSVIIAVNASDADSGDNGNFSFRLLDTPDADAFTMSKDGILSLAQALDRETKSKYILGAIVQDGGIRPRESEASISVIVDDVNDMKPQFERASYKFEVREELPPGTIVGEVIASDADIGDNGRFDYYLRPQDNFDYITEEKNQKHVCIIKTKRKFDIESDPETYTLFVGASDYGKIGRTSEVLLTITIKNINDHPPKFEQTLPYISCVIENTDVGTSILSVHAKDDDKIPVSLKYKLLPLNKSEPSLQLFEISPTNGTIFARNKLSDLKQRVYQMMVSVEEDTIHPFVNYQKVVIFVVPRKSGVLFQDQCVTISEKEQTKPGYILLHGFNYRPQFVMGNYKISKSPGTILPFSILRKTGIINLDARLHRDVQQFYQLNVTAEGKDGEQIHTDSITVNIYVIPKNMYPPRYQRNPEKFVVSENISPNTTFDTLKLPIDGDRGMEGMCIFSIEEPIDAPIRILSIKRQIMFTEPVDREKTGEFVLKVRVHDLAENITERLSNTFTITIKIEDINDNAPRFISNNYTKVPEDARIGLNVVNIVALDPDKGKTNTGIYYNITSGNDDNTFVLNEKTGSLITNKLLDIEKTSKYVLKITAVELRESDSVDALKTTEDLVIEVEDVNNQAPMFTKQEYTAHVREGEPNGTKVVQLYSIDKDKNPKYKEVVYKMIDQYPEFNVHSTSGIISTNFPIDRERKSSYGLRVIVQNVAPPYSKSTCIVHIIVDDINDNSPRFPDGDMLKIHIMENTKPIPRLVHQFAVIDNDDGENAEVTYSILSTVNVDDIFQLDQDTGKLWVNTILDREKLAMYEFIVEASNVRSPYHKCRQNISVLVDDENDENPIFEQALYKVNVNENEKVNSTIVTVYANDADVGENAYIEYSMMNTTHNGAAQFGINHLSGAIYLIEQLDYENKKTYNFTVLARGPGTNSYDTTKVEVHVIDQNDNKPQFTDDVYEFEKKNKQTSSPIGTVKATDADQDGRQQVSYTLFPPSKDFYINSTSGEIFLLSQDIVNGQYRLHVEAKDFGFPSKKNLAEVLITVGDYDRSVLKFLNSSVVFSINENPPVNMKLGKLVAATSIKTDVTYQLTSASNPEDAFAINYLTGELYVNNSHAVDYEKYEHFFLGVLAVMKTPEYHSTFLHVLINLTDLNDNAPSISPVDSPFNITETNEHPFQPKHVYQFLVEDKDKIDKKKLKLEILSGNEEGIFMIDRLYRLNIVKNVDYEKQSRYHLIVRVSDGGHPVRFQDSHIYLNVEDINDNPPMFKDLQPVLVSESTPVGTCITTIKATDIDTVRTRIRYQLMNLVETVNGSLFSIDQNNGKLYLLKKLDYEKKRSYQIKISARDGIHLTFGELTVNVMDVNDHAPMFTNPVYVVNGLQSSLPKGKFIIEVRAVDVDHGRFGHVQYELNPPMDKFTIEQDTGYIITTKAFKFHEGVSLFKLIVVAFDSYRQPGSKNSSAVVELHISRLSTPPNFPHKVYNFTVTESAPVGTVVGKVRAVFSYGMHRQMTYKIANDIDIPFTIDVNQGIIMIKTVIDGEKYSQFTLSIVAEVENMSTRCKVVIIIENINDNPPKFVQTEYVREVYEDVPVNKKLIQVKATDADHPISDAGNIIYSIHSGQQSFEWLEINQTDGWVRTKTKLDRERTRSIQLTIKATDLKGTGMHDFASLNVTVLDVNDHSPEFEIDLLTHEITVREDADPHTPVFKATAFDKDEGENARVSYKLLNGSGIDKFYMNSSAPGWVFTKKKLDFEKASQYNLSVLAYDHGTPQKESSVEYLINVIDVNEYAPKFIRRKIFFQIFADMAIGDVVGNVTASDEDSGKEGIIRYTIEPKSNDAFVINQRTGVISVNRDLRRRNANSQTENVQTLTFTVRADNGPTTSSGNISVSINVNYTCPDCVIKPASIPGNRPPPEMKTLTIIVVLTSIAVFLVVILVCMAYFLRKKGCFSSNKHTTPRFYKRKSNGLSSSVERELLNSGASSFDRLQHFCSEHQTEKSQVSSETGLLPDGSGTARSVSATDKASTYSFGIYHEQAIPESEMQIGETLSDMTLKDFEQDSVFRFSSNGMKNELTKSLISRSTQESSLYSFASTAHPNAYSFQTRQKLNRKHIHERSDSHVSLNDFMEEGGGEAADVGIDVKNLFILKLAEVDAEEQDAIMDGVRPFQEEGPLSFGGSFSTIIGSDDELREPRYAWKQPYHPLNSSVFSEISSRSVHSRPRSNMRENQPMNIHSFAKSEKLSSNSHAQHLDTNSNRPKKKPPDEIPLQSITSGRTSMLSSIQTLPQTPQDAQSNYTSGVLSPNFTPVITPLIFRSPSVSSIGTQDNHSEQPKTINFDVGFSKLRRAESNVSQLSLITLSEISDAEV